MAQNLDHRGAGTLLEGILTVKADINGNGWWTTEYGDGSTSGGSLSVSPAFEVDGVGFEVSRLSVILGDSVDFFLADQGFGAAGSGGLAEARRWVLHLDGQAYRFDAAALGATVAVWRVRVPNWQANTSAAIRIERLPRPDPVLNDDGSETLWDAMVEVGESNPAGSVGYINTSGTQRGSADPDSFDYRGTTYDVEEFDWRLRGGIWQLFFQVNGTRAFPGLSLYGRLAAEVDGARIAVFDFFNDPAGNAFGYNATVADPGYSDGDDIDVQLILLNRPGAPREVAVAMDETAGTATVTWLPPARNGGAAITGYTVERSSTVGTWTQLGTTDGETTTYTDTAPSTASRVLYRVQAANRVGGGPHAVDSVPAVVGVEVVSTPAENGTYRFGEPIDVVATFGRSVWVHGEAELALQFDGETVNARYAYGSGTPNLTFRYLVRNGDFAGSIFLVPKNALAHDGDPALGALGGGFVKSVRGVDARLGSPQGSNRFPGQRVDGSALFDDGDRIWQADMRVGESAAGDVLGYARGGVGTDGRHGTLSPDTFSHTDPDGNVCQHAVHNVHYRQDAEGDWWFVFEFTGLPHDPFRRYGRLRFYKAVLDGSETLEAFVLADADRYERATHTTAAWWRTDAPSGHTAVHNDRHVSLSLLSPPSDPPTMLDIEKFGAALKLTWESPDEHGSAAINGYRIEHDPTETDDWRVLVADTFSTATERFVRVGLGTSASYRVRALGLRGAASEPSNQLHAFTDPPDEDEAAARIGTDAWCGTLTNGTTTQLGHQRVGYSSDLTIGSLEPATFRYLGTDHTVQAIVEVPAVQSVAFLVAPALPGSAGSWTFRVGERLFGHGDAGRGDFGDSEQWTWSLDEPLLVDGESVEVCLRSAVVQVKRDSALIPDGVGTGERYRLLFVTSNFHPGAGPDDVDGASLKISDYNRAVRERARTGSHRGNPIRPFADAFAALASTPGTDARDNAGTGGFDLFTEGAIPWQATLTVGVSVTESQLGHLMGNTVGSALDLDTFTHAGESYTVDDLYEDSDRSCAGGRELNLFMDPGGERLRDLGAILEVGDARFPLASAGNVLVDTFNTVFNFCDPAIGWAAGEEVRVRFRIPPDPAGDLGVPVYWLNGANAWSLPEHPDERTPWVKVADDYAELHGGLWQGEGSPRDEWGEHPCSARPCPTHVATGSRGDGAADPGFEMGMESIRAGALNDPDAGGPLDAGITVARGDRLRLYGISPVLEVRATKPSIWGVRATDDRSNEIEVTWRLNDNGAPLTSLKVQEQIDSEWVDATENLDAEARSHLFEDLVGSGIRRYRVVAVNREGRRISGWVTGKTVGPTRPRIQYFRASKGLVNAIELSWAVRENGSDLTGLVVEELDLGTLTWSDAWTAPIDRPSGRHTFEDLDDGFAWTVRLRATNAVGTTTSGEVTGGALRAFRGGFGQESAPHDGAGTTFERTLELTGELDADDMCDVLKVIGGNCQSSRKGVVEVPGGDRFESWEVVIAPDGDDDVTLTLPAPTDCEADGAVCATDGRLLAETVTVTVAGPGSMHAVDLTAEFVADSVPARHEGAGSTFTPQVRFNQAVDVDDLCAAVEVTDGACTAAAHEVGDTALWDLTIVPDGGKPVTVALPETTDCDAAGAVCTADDGPLATAIEVTVKGPLLEASWASLPETHAGGGATYTARVRFSRGVDVADLCDAFLVTNGTCTAAATVGGDAALWEIEVEPDGSDDLTLSLEITTDCAAARAVCTADGEPLAYGVLAVVPRTPLTVAVESVPDDHGGIGTTFTVRVRFSEAVDVDGLCDAFYPHAATCDSSARVGGDAALWDVVFAPEGAAAAELALPGTADCADADAVCTADDEPLTGGFLEIVPRRPFTAAWVDGSYPANHEGAGTTFTVRVRFSEDAVVSYLVLRDEALEVDEGDCNGFRRVDGRKDLWEATIAPDGLEAVSLTLDSPADCDAADAVCTQDDVPLSTVLELTVPGPSPGNSVVEPMLREERPPRERR